MIRTIAHQRGRTDDLPQGGAGVSQGGFSSVSSEWGGEGVASLQRPGYGSQYESAHNFWSWPNRLGLKKCVGAALRFLKKNRRRKTPVNVKEQTPANQLPRSITDCPGIDSRRVENKVPRAIDFRPRLCACTHAQVSARLFCNLRKLVEIIFQHLAWSFGVGYSHGISKFSFPFFILYFLVQISVLGKVVIPSPQSFHDGPVVGFQQGHGFKNFVSQFALCGYIKSGNILGKFILPFTHEM